MAIANQPIVQQPIVHEVIPGPILPVVHNMFVGPVQVPLPANALHGDQVVLAQNAIAHNQPAPQVVIVPTENVVHGALSAEVISPLFRSLYGQPLVE